MKKYSVFAVLICTLLITKNILAQNPVATLEHNGTTQVFYGSNALVDAYQVSVNGDEILLSTGFFSPPVLIEKGIKIIGAGHFPDSANVARRTTISGNINISGNGADSLHLEGLFVNSSINFYDLPTNNVTVLRCGLSGINFNSSSIANGKNYCSIIECYVGSVSFSNYGENLLIRHCVILDRISDILDKAIIEGNILLNESDLFWQYYTLINISGAIIRNNIFLDQHEVGLHNNSTNNSYNNNLFVFDTISFANNTCYGNYYNGVQSDLFVNQNGDQIDYTNDYHLKNPGLYLGTDGTQIGIYGGTVPFKEKGLPSNPQVITKSVASETDAGGNLNINFTVKAQEN